MELELSKEKDIKNIISVMRDNFYVSTSSHEVGKPQSTKVRVQKHRKQTNNRPVMET